MDILPINAADLLQDPEQAGLRQVHAQLEASQEPGRALYFAKENPRIRRPDFLIGLEDQAYFALQVADQPHGVRDGKLVLAPAPAAGITPTLSPVGSVSAHAVGISKDVKKRLGYRIFVIPVAVFVGEDPDNTVQAWAITHNVRLLFSTDRLVDRLAGIAREYADQIYAPPAMVEIQRVVGVFNAVGLPQADMAAEEMVSEAGPAHTPDEGLTARQVIIQHADTVNVYTIGAGGDGARALAVARDGREVDMDML